MQGEQQHAVDPFSVGTQRRLEVRQPERPGTMRCVEPQTPQWIAMRAAPRMVVGVLDLGDEQARAKGPHPFCPHVPVELPAGALATVPLGDR